MANQDNEKTPLSLPEDCIAVILSFTSPKDACRAAAVSPEFRSAANSDNLWERFLPYDYKNITGRSVSPVIYSTKKELYFMLCKSPLLLDGGKLHILCSNWKRVKASIKLVKENSAIESEKETNIVYIDTPIDDEYTYRWRRSVPPRDAIEVRFSRKRLDGWMELELGEFSVGEGLDEGQVQAELLETEHGIWRCGLVLEGIEFRPKESKERA
ncbi:hypothetical protein RD792_007908 [Penstemon davidsonii]|uniref:F-box domain-containing protein n=1 Tax=Penstemon davidsonii TaxID=160366 RepID=A0ABR0D8Z9_9LAMI|nr:hypothetical protein RD792_007908 [Penstemon davidsonii]